MLEALHHRGPDSSDSVTISPAEHPVWLCQTRLAILDLSPAGRQPMRSSDGRWWVTFNGEIYNHLEIRKSLNVAWRGHSDTETLVEGLAAWGIDALLGRLNGMFAFAAVDTSDNRLHLARDPFGIKPVYYAERADGFAFASEIRALRAILGESVRVNADALQAFLALRYVPGPATLFTGINRLQPGHVLHLDLRSGERETRCFIEPTRERFRGTREDAVEAYHTELRAAVERQLLSDVPVGVLLSGGIDSAMVATFARECGRVLPGYTVGFGSGHSECEIADAAETARVLGLPHHAVTVTPENLWNALEQGIAHVEEPLGTTSILPMWHLTERARRDVTVVLTGQGSDEPWGGYRRYQGELLREHFHPSALGALKLLTRMGATLPEFARRAVASLPIADENDRFEAAYTLFTPEERMSLSGRADSGVGREAIGYWLEWVRQQAGLRATERMMRIDARMNLADDLLLYGDKLSMAHSLEARVPMLDLDLVRFVESLPLGYRVTVNRTKIVHKMAAQRYLPASIVKRKKKAFQIPFSAMSRGVWRNRIADVLLGADGPHLSILRRAALEHIWRQHVSGKHDAGRQVFALLTLAMCLRDTLPQFCSGEAYNTRPSIRVISPER